MRCNARTSGSPISDFHPCSTSETARAAQSEYLVVANSWFFYVDIHPVVSNLVPRINKARIEVLVDTVIITPTLCDKRMTVAVRSLYSAYSEYCQNYGAFHTRTNYNAPHGGLEPTLTTACYIWYGQLISTPTTEYFLSGRVV